MDSATIANNLATYDQGRVTSTDAMNQALSQYGVPEIRKTVSGLRTTIANTGAALNAVDPSVTGRTSGSLVTEAQRTKQVANERAPIAQQLGDQTGALNQNQADLTDALSQATQVANNRVNDWNSGRAALVDERDSAYKREQDAAAAQTAKDAAARAQANADRQYALDQQANNRANAASSVVKAPTKEDVASHIVQSFNSLKGNDQHVSNETWANALNDWTSVGGSIRDFWKNYQSYVNTKYKSSYAGFSNR